MTNTNAAAENTPADKTHFALVRGNGRVDGAWSLDDAEALDFMKKSARKYANKGENVRLVKITSAQAAQLDARFMEIAAALKPLDEEMAAARKAIDHSWHSVEIFERAKRRIDTKIAEVMKRYDSVRLPE